MQAQSLYSVHRAPPMVHVNSGLPHCSLRYVVFPLAHAPMMTMTRFITSRLRLRSSPAVCAGLTSKAQRPPQVRLESEASGRVPLSLLLMPWLPWLLLAWSTATGQPIHPYLDTRTGCHTPVAWFSDRQLPRYDFQ